MLNLNTKYDCISLLYRIVLKLLFNTGKLNEPELIRYDILEAFIMTSKDNRSVNTIRGPSQIEITLLISQLVLSLAEIFFPQKITCLHQSEPPFHP